MKELLRKIKNIPTRNLLLLLALYILIILIDVKPLYSVTTESLILLLIIVSSFRWRLKGGIISSIIGSGIITIAHFFREGSTIRGVITGSLGYFAIGITLGIMFRPLERQQLQLQESERRYYNLYNQLRTYFDLVQVMIVALDREGRVTSINRKGCEILGYREEEIIGKNWFDNFIPERIREEIKEVFRKLMNGEIEPVEYYENPILTKDGRERIIAWHNSVIRDSSGFIVKILSAGEDITELKEMESQIQEQLNIISALYKTAETLLIEELNTYKRAKITARICVEDLGADLAWIGLAEPDGRVSIIAQYPENHPYTKDLTIRWDDSPYGQGPSGRTIKTGKPQISENIPGNSYFEPWRVKALESGFYTSGAFPLLTREKVIGVLNIYSSKPGFFTSKRIELLQNFAHISAFSLENAKLFEETQNRFKMIQALRNIDMAITGSLDPRVVFNVALDEITLQLNIDAVDILRLNPYTQRLEYTAGRGFHTHIIENTSIPIGEDIAGRAALERHTICIQNLAEDNKWVRRELISAEGFVTYYAVPLIAKGRVLGVLEIFHRLPLEENKEWQGYLETLAGQVAIAIDNTELLHNLQQSNIKLIQAYEATIEGWAKALELRDRETKGHSQRVQDLTTKIARHLGIGDEEIAHIRRGALLHDIGKMGVPDSILLKPSKLTDEEWEIMKMHPVYAYQMLSTIEYLRPALDIPYCHHERWDGSGYPRGLKGKEIPLSARIFAVVDVYDALTSDRPYRKAWTKEEAINYIKEQSGKQFDPEVVEAFLEVISNNR
ncbi:GAF domain-containing protein [bacterium]|nr:GAF domain-containing protein [bacterium]